VLLRRDGVLLSSDDLLGVVDQEEREEDGHQRAVNCKKNKTNIV